MEAQAAARDFVQRNLPTARVAFLGGSAANGHATTMSDLDIFVLVDDGDGEVSYVETTRHQGWLVEAFVYTPASAEHWIKKGRDERRPVLDCLIATGLALTDTDETREWADGARRALAAGPGGADPEEIDARRYALSALVDDLEGSIDPAETYAVQACAFWEAAELALLVERRWLGTGKWLIRNLAAGKDFGLLAWAAGPQDASALGSICRAVLDRAGGFLQEGFVRGRRPGRPAGVGGSVRPTGHQ